LVTTTVAEAALVKAPADTSVRLSALLAPESCVAESSVMLVEVVELKVSEPKFTVPAAGMLIAPAFAVNEAFAPTLSVSVALSASVIDVPVKLAPLVIVWLVLAASVIEPVELNTRLCAVFVPVITVAESSAMLTAPAEL
jgi:hypothetical protein